MGPVRYLKTRLFFWHSTSQQHRPLTASPSWKPAATLGSELSHGKVLPPLPQSHIPQVTKSCHGPHQTLLSYVPFQMSSMSLSHSRHLSWTCLLSPVHHP